MQRHQITVTITGAPSSGKSAIAQAITAILRNQNVRVTNNDPDVVRPRSYESLALAFIGISRKTGVVVNVISASPALEGEILAPGWPHTDNDKL